MNILNRAVAVASLAIAMQAQAQPQTQAQVPAKQANTRNLVVGICGPITNGNSVAERNFDMKTNECVADLLKGCGPEYKGTTGAESYANQGVKSCNKQAQKK